MLPPLGSAASDADPPRLLELEEPFPIAKPISDAPCHSAGTAVSAPMHRPVALETHAFAHASIDLHSQDVSSTTRLGVAVSAPGAPSIMSLHRDLAASAMDTRSGFDPRTGIEHPFAPTLAVVRVNGPTTLPEARSHCSLVFQRSRNAIKDAHDR